MIDAIPAPPSASRDHAAAKAPAQEGERDVRVRLLLTVPELQQAELLLREVWQTEASETPLALDIMCALTHTGGYVAAAFIGEDMVGVAAGFRTVHGSLHSHVAGVRAEWRGRGIGRALKQHQRQWVAEKGLPSISWTFDPLIRRNAYFNLNRLGAVAESYIPDFYGPLSDGINDGELTDRLFVTWATGDTPRADPLPELSELEPILDIGPGEEPIKRDTNARLVRCAIPIDAEAMRQQNPELAQRWRMMTRDALGTALGAGYQIFGFHPSGWYLLCRKDTSA